MNAPNPQAPNGASADIADTVQSVAAKLTPADRGWILAVVIIILSIQVVDYFSAQRLTEYLLHMESTRNREIVSYMETCSDQVRRAQEAARDLAQALSRDADRAGRAAVAAIGRAGELKEVMDNLPPAPDPLREN